MIGKNPKQVFNWKALDSSWLEDGLETGASISPKGPIPIGQEVKIGFKVNSCIDMVMWVSGPNTTIKPDLQTISSSKKMQTVFVNLTPHKVGKLELTISFRLPKSFNILQEFIIEPEVCEEPDDN